MSFLLTFTAYNFGNWTSIAGMSIIFAGIRGFVLTAKISSRATWLRCSECTWTISIYSFNTAAIITIIEPVICSFLVRISTSIHCISLHFCHWCLLLFCPSFVQFRWWNRMSAMSLRARMYCSTFSPSIWSRLKNVISYVFCFCHDYLALGYSLYLHSSSPCNTKNCQTG